jgi:hypothetical protein
MNQQYTETVVFVGHEVKSGMGQRGPWTLNLFTDQQGRSFQTFDGPTASMALGLLNQPISVTFEAKQNGQFTNYEIKGILPAQGGVAVPVAAAPAPAAVQAAPPAQAAPPSQGVTGAEKDARISRAASLDRALTAFGISQEDPLANLEDLYALANEFFDYITTGSTATTSSVAVAAGPTV